MIKKRYIYNVSYFHQNGNGSSQIIRKTKINSLADFLEVKSFIEERNNLKNVAIINFQLICKTPVAETESDIEWQTKE